MGMKKWLIEKLRGNEKIVSTAITLPIIAAGTISGACAAGCPYGLVNDPYPGQCPRYIDVSGDGICDLSQAAGAASTSTTTSSSESSSTSSTDPSTGNNDQSVSNGAQDNGSIDQNGSTNASTIPDSGSGFDSSAFGDGGGYYVLPISFLLIGGYFLTHLLFNRGILSQKKHRRLWNLLVTGGYIGTGITGVLLTVMINLGIRTALNPSITLWHAELAILMVIGTLIHIHLYKKPFKKMFKVLFGFKNSESNENSERYSNYSK
jgi:hypothetical protein